LNGLRPDVPPEVYEAHDYLWRELSRFTTARCLLYHPPIEIPPGFEFYPYEYVEPYTWEDVVKVVELMERFPEMELGI
jgi:hypothetical protein